MKTIKFILRVFISVVVGIPTLWILYLAFTCLGLLFLVPIAGIIGVPFFWVINDREGVEESIDSIKDGGYLIIAPIMFWYFFIIGKNPFTEMGI